MNLALETALRYAERGLFVFPLWPLKKTKDGSLRCSCLQNKKCKETQWGKHPLPRHGLSEATRDQKQITNWWDKNPTSGIGINCGLSGLFVIDADGSVGEHTLAGLCKDAGKELPVAPTVITRQGRHLYYALPNDGSDPPPSSVGKHGLGLKLDIRCAGGFAVAPPSQHKSGHIYRWEYRGFEISMPEKFPEVPKWITDLYKKVLKDSRDKRNAVGDEALVHAGRDGHPTTKDEPVVLMAIQGARNETLISLAGSMRRRGMGKQAIVFALKAENQRRCSPPLEGSEVEKIATSVMKYQPQTDKVLGIVGVSKPAARSQEERAAEAEPAIAPDEMTARRLELIPPVKKPALDSTPSNEDIGAGWQQSLRQNNDGAITKDYGNATLILAWGPDWIGKLRFDEFAQQIVWAERGPALLGFRPPAPGTPWKDTDRGYVHHWLCKRTAISFSIEGIERAVNEAAVIHSYHPVRNWLYSLKWDGTPRLTDWLMTYMGAVAKASHDYETTESQAKLYIQSVGTWWMLSAIARVMIPGCQADHVIVLEGKQGIGKSTAIENLFGKEWYRGKLPDLRSKDAYTAIQGNWVIEIAELDALRRADIALIKDFLSQRVDKYRPPYGRVDITSPRQCVFIGTTNEDRYLRDATGARRFWPVHLTAHIRQDAILKDREQLWAEAFVRWSNGEKWWPEVNDKSKSELAKEQEERRERHPWETIIEIWIKSPRVRGRKFTVNDVLADCLKMEPHRWGRGEETTIGIMLKNQLGCSKRKQTHKGIREYYYWEGNTVEPTEILSDYEVGPGRPENEVSE